MGSNCKQVCLYRYKLLILEFIHITVLTAVKILTKFTGEDFSLLLSFNLFSPCFTIIE